MTKSPSPHRKYLSPSAKARVLQAYDNICYLCNAKFSTGDKIEFDHTTPRAMANSDNQIIFWHTGADGKHETIWIDVNDERNFAPLHAQCHKFKTNGNSKVTTYGSDSHIIAKSDRILGRTCTGPKQKIPSRPFQTNRDGRFKKTFNGIEHRNK